MLWIMQTRQEAGWEISKNALGYFKNKMDKNCSHLTFRRVING